MGHDDQGAGHGEELDQRRDQEPRFTTPGTRGASGQEDPEVQAGEGRESQGQAGAPGAAGEDAGVVQSSLIDEDWEARLLKVYWECQLYRLERDAYRTTLEELAKRGPHGAPLWSADYACRLCRDTLDRFPN